MKTKINILLLAIFAISCGQPKEENVGLEGKLKELATLKAQHNELAAKIKTIEDEILILDPKRGAKAKLVSTITLTPEGFNHYIGGTSQIADSQLS